LALSFKFNVPGVHPETATVYVARLPVTVIVLQVALEPVVTKSVFAKPVTVSLKISE
jgi:hypothetical protein